MGGAYGRYAPCGSSHCEKLYFQGGQNWAVGGGHFWVVISKLSVSPALFGCETCFGLRVIGDSMVDAHILDGDVAIIRPQKSVENGEIAAVLVEGLLSEATLKVVYRTRTTLTLTPANPAHVPLVFKGKQRGKVSIIGKYVGVVRRA